MTVEQFEAIADDYVPRGQRRFKTPQEVARFFKLASDCAGEHPVEASWIAEIASGVTALAGDEAMPPGGDLEAVHVLFLQLMAELGSESESATDWTRVQSLLAGVSAQLSP